MIKVLIVDDNRHLANLTKIALVKKGYEVALISETFEC